MGITSKVETITPEIAKKMLEQNTGNFRTIDKSRVVSYANEIASGNWDVNGESIKFNGDVLLDGQHRLYAIIKAGVAIQTVVTRGVQSSAVHIDRGRPRSIGQWLRSKGIRSANNVAAIARMAVAHGKGLWATQSWGYGCMTDSEVLQFALDHTEAIHGAVPGSRIRGVTSSLIAAITLIGCGNKNPQHNTMAVWFRDALITGADASDTDAVFHFRNRLLAANTNTEKLTPYMTRMLLTLAWNKTCKGEACSANSLRLRLSGAAKQMPPKEVMQAPAEAP